MFSLARFLVIAVCVLNVQARNDTLVHGWIPEPPGRGTWSIIWSCLATIFICTWSALHLDVPKRHGRWYLVFRKIRWMLVAVVAPEFVLAGAAENFFEARDRSRFLVARHPEWTMTHMQFAQAHGFRSRTPEGNELECRPRQLQEFIEKDKIDGPSISIEELQARGKNNWVTQLIAVLQIVWFVVQTLFRKIQHYQITALEIMTIAFVFCSVFTYGFYLHQPQDVEYPVVLDVRDAAPATNEATPMRSTNESNHAGEEAEPAHHIRRLEKVPSGLPSPYVPGQARAFGYFIPFGLSACGFGAIHCLAWNSPFPTSRERLAWRICSVTTTALSVPYIPLIHRVTSLEESSMSKLDNSTEYLTVLMMAVYIIGRATLIVLAFMTLRALPADAFQTVNWNNYIPHFAA